MMFAVPLPAFNPELISFEIAGADFAVRWYALSYVAGFLIAWRWFISMMERPGLWPDAPPMDRAAADRLLTWIIIGAILGGRFGYALFYNPAHYLEYPLEVFAVWRGGMSFHGGLAGLIAATIIFCRLNRAPIASVGDAISVVAMPGLFLGRIANFINGELWGEPSQLPWAVIYPQGLASVCPDGWAGVCSRHPSQIYEALLEGALLCAVFAWLAYRRNAFKIPGQVMGLFFAGYGAARTVAELFRVSDSQMKSAGNPEGYAIQFGDWGLSMGQTLSLPMIALGIGIFIWSRSAKK